MLIMAIFSTATRIYNLQQPVSASPISCLKSAC